MSNEAALQCAAEIQAIFARYGVVVDVVIARNPFTRTFEVCINPRRTNETCV